MSEDWWATKVRITCESKHGVCEHEVGDSYVIEHVQDYVKGLCSLLRIGDALVGERRQEHLSYPLHLQAGNGMET